MQQQHKLLLLTLSTMLILILDHIGRQNVDILESKS